MKLDISAIYSAKMKISLAETFMVVYNVIQSNQVVKGDQYHGQAEYQGKYCQH